MAGTANSPSEQDTTYTIPIPTPPPKLCWINSLPDELIADILTTTVAPPSDAEWGCYSLREEAEFPMIAQQVCRQWRLVVCHTPVLWTVLDIRSSRNENYDLYFERSGVLGLRVRLEIFSHQHYDEADSLGESIGALQERVRHVDLMIDKHAQRIQRLMIKGEEYGELREYIAGIRDKFCNLRQFAVSGGPIVQFELHFGLDLVTPRLRSLLFDGYLLNWKPMPIAPDLEELCVMEPFDPSLVTLDAFTKAIRAYPYLRRLELHNAHIGGDGGKLSVGLPAPLILGRLEELTLTGVSMEELDRIFSVLSTPRLRNLRLVEGNQRSSRILERLPVLHLPLLETLLLEIEPRFALEIARQLPSIKHLDLQRPIHSHAGLNRAFEALVLHWRTLPKSIALETLCTRGVRPATLLSLLGDSRAEVVPSLRRVSVHYADILLSKNQQSFGAHAKARANISAEVELEIWGLSPESLDARAQVNSWEEEQTWGNRFDIRMLMTRLLE